MLADGIDPVRLNDIRGEAEKLEKFGLYTAAKRVKGMIASICGDVKEIDKQFNAALLNSGRDIVVLLNYATALGNIHHHTRCVEVADEAVSDAPDDLLVLDTAIQLQMDAYNVDRVRSIQEQLEKLGRRKMNPIFYAKLDAIDDILSKAGATWNQISARIELVADTLREQGLPHTMFSEALSEGVILYEFVLHADIATVIAAEKAVQQAIADKPFSPADRAIAFSCAPA